MEKPINPGRNKDHIFYPFFMTLSTTYSWSIDSLNFELKIPTNETYIEKEIENQFDYLNNEFFGLSEKAGQHLHSTLILNS